MSSDNDKAKQLSKYWDGDINGYGRKEHTSCFSKSAKVKKGHKHNRRKVDSFKDNDGKDNLEYKEYINDMNHHHNDNNTATIVHNTSIISKRRRYDSSSSASKSDSDSNSHRYKGSSKQGRKSIVKDGHKRRLRRYESSNVKDLSNDSSPQEEVHMKNKIGEGKNKRERYESSSESSIYSTGSNDTSGDDSPTATENRNLKSSQSTVNIGHIAGLQSGSNFASQESEIQRNRKADALRMVDKYGVGETVYRDSKKSGIASNKSDTPLNEQEQHLLQTSRIQREKLEEQRREFKHLQQAPFARYKDDRELQEYHKNIIHKDDPMAVYAIAKQQHDRAATVMADNRRRVQQPVYKGPQPKPNRFGIRPGYRWDAHDRGNGFEDRLLSKRFSAQHQSELSYRNSSADM
jgi:pre-mRNA-splicing factor CWC26